MVLMSSVDYQYKYASRSNSKLMNIGSEWIVWIHRQKGLQYITANNLVPRKLQLHFVAVRLINYSRVEIFYL